MQEPRSNSGSSSRRSWISFGAIVLFGFTATAQQYQQFSTDEQFFFITDQYEGMVMYSEDYDATATTDDDTDS